MPLQLHRAERTDVLADELADLLATPPDDPFAQEVVVVPERGVERWLTQRLSHRLGTSSHRDASDGVCAGVRFLRPASLVTMLLGRDRDDVWLPERLVWAVLQTIDEHLDEPWAAPLARHLGRHDEGPQAQIRAGRRYAVAQRIAFLLHSYAQQRPALLTAWRAGRDEDGLGAPLDPDLTWQPQLWRALTAQIPGPPPDQRHRDTCARLAAGASDLALPDRLSLFGHTRLARTDVELLSALATRREVHLWLPQTSPALWDALDEAAAQGPVRRRDDRTADLVAHPLLASLGRDSRELRRTLGPVAPLDIAVPGTAASASRWLGWLQADLRANRAPDQRDRAARPLAPDDRSVQVHACHGPARQVEVLREVLVGLLQDDPTLQPRDVLVMCPDIETYAPLIQAGFGLHDIDLAAPGEARRTGHPAHELRVSLADRALTSTNPLLDFAARLVAFAGGRVTASEVLDLAALPPVRRRFRLDDDDLATLAEWVRQTAIRWGLDEQHRARYDLGWLRANTWAAGLDQVALGVAMAAGPGHQLAGTLPLDDVDSARIDLAGRFAELLDRLAATIESLTDARSAVRWMQALGEGVGGLTDVPADDAWQVAQLDRELATIAAAAGEATALRLTDIRILLERQLGGRPTRSSFRTGSLTVCTMTPMRSVPHRVVCLLGLDDGVFPRDTSLDGDDVLARSPVTGERDRRSEDRQLLLDAVLAATDHLVLTYSGADEHTGAPRPPAVPLGELIDAARATVNLPGERDVVVRHPLQAHDSRNLTAQSLGTPGPFTFDAAALAGARALQRDPVPAPPLLTAALPALPPADIALDDLLRFFDNPAKAFLRDRLDVGLVREAEEPDDALAVELAPGLDKWKLGDRLLQDALRGMPIPQVAATERMRGQLPPAELGNLALREAGQSVDQILSLAQPLRSGPARPVDIDVDLGQGRRLAGTVAGVHGHDRVQVTYSTLGAKGQLAAWICALALAAGAEGDSWRSHIVGRRSSRGGARSAVYGPLEADHARGVLCELADVYDRGMREPIPFMPKTSRRYAEAVLGSSRRSEISARSAARGIWEGGSFPGENDDAAQAMVHGPGSPLETLLVPPLPDEAWSGATTRLGQYALRVFGPMLAWEKQ